MGKGAEEKEKLRPREHALFERRLQIRNAAITCILAKGYHATGMRDIASHAKVSLGNLYNHFPSKHEILLEIARSEAEAIEPLVDLLHREGEESEILHDFIKSYSVLSDDEDSWALFLEIIAEAARNEEISDAFIRTRNTLSIALQELIERGKGSGSFHHSVPSDSTAQFVLDLIEGASFRRTSDPKAKPDREGALEAFIQAALESSHGQ
jgi:AcrR family transcriptional regulator